MNTNKVITLVPEGTNNVDENEVQWLKSRLRTIIKTENVEPESIKLNTTKIQAVRAYLEILKYQEKLPLSIDVEDTDFCIEDLGVVDPVIIASEIRKKLQA